MGFGEEKREKEWERELGRDRFIVLLGIFVLGGREYEFIVVGVERVEGFCDSFFDLVLV